MGKHQSAQKYRRCRRLHLDDRCLLAVSLEFVIIACKELTSNDKRRISSIHGVLYKRADIRFPLSFDLADIEFSAGYQVINEARVANRPNNDWDITGVASSCASAPITVDACNIEDYRCIGSGSGGSGGGQRAIDLCNATEIQSKVVGSSQYTRPICGVNVDVDWCGASGEEMTSIASSEADSGLSEALNST